jgi:hypothetical protein
VVRDGREASRFQGRNLLEARGTFRQSGYVHKGDETQLEVRLPYPKQDALLQLSTRIGHPDLGKGLYQRLTLPHGRDAANDAAMARLCLKLNERELAERTRMHSLGSWCPSPGGVSHVAFFPNYMVPLVPRCVGVLALGEATRAAWVERLGLIVV